MHMSLWVGSISSFNSQNIPILVTIELRSVNSPTEIPGKTYAIVRLLTCTWLEMMRADRSYGAYPLLQMTTLYVTFAKVFICKEK